MPDWQLGSKFKQNLRGHRAALAQQIVMEKISKTLNRTERSAGKIIHAILQYLDENSGRVKKGEIIKAIPERVELDDWELERTGKYNQPRWRSRLWYTIDAVKAGFLVKERGTWSITDEGRAALSMSPDELALHLVNAYREWVAKEGVSSRSKSGAAKFEDRAVLLSCLMATAQAAPGKTLVQGELLQRAVHSLPDDVAESLNKKADNWAETVAGRVLRRATRAGWFERVKHEWTLSEVGANALTEWADPLDLLTAMRATLDDEPEGDNVLPYHGPVQDCGNIDQALYAPQFHTIQQLVQQIQSGSLALPDIQRPFVWKNTKVRDLLDSMFQGFPFGYFLTWKNPNVESAHQIGLSPKGQAVPHALVIDGQQRLTSLFAVFTGEKILDKKFKQRQIRIAFHPIQARFEVADAAIAKNAEWLPDVTALFADARGPYAITEEYLMRLEKVREIEEIHRTTVRQNLMRLSNLKSLAVHVLEISMDAGEEEVANIFVRINSKGQNLRQSDFILTLLAVYWEQGREQLETFARQCVRLEGEHQASPFNHQLHPGPDDMIRPVVALGHRRARLSAAYQILRGKDPSTGVLCQETRIRNFEKLEAAQVLALDVANWHEFLKSLSTAGYRHKKLIWSQVTALYTYSFFLFGRTVYKVPLPELRNLIARWFIMSTLTGRYVGGSSETTMEEDLARLRDINDGEAAGFKTALEGAMATELTNDFWEITLPSRFDSSSGRTSSSFFAAQSVLNAPALFSSLSVPELLSPDNQSTKEHLEVHHLFPKAWLQRNSFNFPRIYNQVANMSLLEWPDNISVSDRPAADYVPEMRRRFSSDDLHRMEDLHALPQRWWEMEYLEFLKERRILMAGVIRRAFERLG